MKFNKDFTMMKVWEDYKKLTLNIIKSIEEDREDIQLFVKREKIIEDLLNSKLSKEGLKISYKEEKVNELDIKLEDTLKNRIQNVKEEMKKVAVIHKANKFYSNVNRNRYFFSTKV